MTFPGSLLPTKKHLVPPLKGEAVKKFTGRDALPRVRNGKATPDAEHRVPTKRN